MTRGVMKALLVLAVAVFPVTSWSAGALNTGVLHSDALGGTKKYRIYLPEGYGEGSTRYPVIYQLHGWGATEATWTGPGLRLQSVADDLQLQAIIVMPDGDRSMYLNSLAAAEYQACLQGREPVRNREEKRIDLCARRLNYETYLVSELIPHIDATYQTIDDSNSRAISGESMGGFGAMHLALRHDLFASVVSHSGLLSLLLKGAQPSVAHKTELWSEITPQAGREEVEAHLGYAIDNWRKYDPYSIAQSGVREDLAIYFDVGTEDEVGSFEMSSHFHELLDSKEIAHTFVAVPGGHHDDAFFARRAPHGLRFHIRRFQLAGVYPQGSAD